MVLIKQFISDMRDCRLKKNYWKIKSSSGGRCIDELEGFNHKIVQAGVNSANRCVEIFMTGLQVTCQKKRQKS